MLSKDKYMRWPDQWKLLVIRPAGQVKYWNIFVPCSAITSCSENHIADSLESVRACNVMTAMQFTVLSQTCQGCGNTMPDFPTWSPFHSGQFENFYFLVLGQAQCIIANTILYFIFWLIIMSSHLALKTVWILISWLLKKPADLDLNCLQEKPADQDPYCLQKLISCFILFLKRVNCLSTESYKADK